MSDKFFFKGRKNPKPKHESFGYNTKRASKLGTPDNPLTLVVSHEERKKEIESQLNKHNLTADIQINSEVKEDIVELEAILALPRTILSDKKPNRNEPCHCGSGQKYKKCCG
ncbi:SEC-C domain-containing protein [Shewanella sp. VB17]|uniref:PBPRA1643 family SWIM/SEC-C metal-binding motif protein n=1 Tax=Shewanella sp. VB17 TaxID=2739432 RepID=UPI001565525D|nr:PBPRA1643 family SWIM/SEC-C metal-binding motif protein [Shewanella sp. VB17]NRD74864.1 SEC-C domain-containing protein [Shewanella sp. VB17]